MTGAQVREARRLLGWSSHRVGRLCGFSHELVHAFEKTGQMRQSMFARTNPVDRLAMLRAVFEAAGVEFINGDGSGVKLREVQPCPRRAS